MSPEGIDLVQSSAKREDARLSSSGRINWRPKAENGELQRNRTDGEVDAFPNDWILSR